MDSWEISQFNSWLYCSLMFDLRQAPNLSVPQVPHMQSGENTTTYLLECIDVFITLKTAIVQWIQTIIINFFNQSLFQLSTMISNDLWACFGHKSLCASCNWHFLEMDHWPMKCIFFGLNGKHKSAWKYPFKTLKIINIFPYQLLFWDNEVWKELELE